MGTRYVIIILIVFLLGGLWWLFSPSRNIEVRSTAAEAQSSSPARVNTQPAPRSPASLSPERQEQRRQWALESQALQMDLLAEQRLLEEIQDQVEYLRQQKDQMFSEPPPGSMTPMQVQDNNLLIQQLSASLTQYQDAERLAQQEGAQSLSLEISAAQAEQQQVEENIRQQEIQIRQTQEDMTYWQYGGSNYVTEKEARLNELQLILTQQQEQLAAMRDQRMGLISSAFQNRRAIQEMTQSAMRSIANERADVQAQISDLRGINTQARSVQQQTRTTQMSLSTQISQMEKNFQDQQLRVRAVEDAILSKERQIQAIE